MKMTVQKWKVEAFFGRTVASEKVLLRGDTPAFCKLTITITEVVEAHQGAR
jgi:hypothetical protein